MERKKVMLKFAASSNDVIKVKMQPSAYHHGQDACKMRAKCVALFDDSYVCSEENRIFTTFQCHRIIHFYLIQCKMYELHDSFWALDCFAPAQNWHNTIGIYSISIKRKHLIIMRTSMRDICICCVSINKREYRCKAKLSGIGLSMMIHWFGKWKHICCHIWQQKKKERERKKKQKSNKK